MSSLAIDRLSPEELRGLAAWEQAAALNDLMAELKRLADLQRKTNDLLFDAKKMMLDGDDTLSAKRLQLDATRVLTNLKFEVAARKEQVKILQTLLRAIPA